MQQTNLESTSNIPPTDPKKIARAIYHEIQRKESDVDKIEEQIIQLAKFSTEQNKILDKQVITEETLLCAAASLGKIAIVKKLLERGADLKAKSVYTIELKTKNETLVLQAIHAAILNHKSKTLKFLLDHEPCTFSDYALPGQTLGQFAVTHGNQEVLKVLFEKFGRKVFDEKNSNDASALGTAIKNAINDPDEEYSVKYLISVAGLIPNEKSLEKIPEKCIAMKKKYRTEPILKIIKDSIASFNKSAQNSNKNSPSISKKQSSNEVSSKIPAKKKIPPQPSSITNKTSKNTVKESSKKRPSDTVGKLSEQKSTKKPKPLFNPQKFNAEELPHFDEIILEQTEVSEIETASAESTKKRNKKQPTDIMQEYQCHTLLDDSHFNACAPFATKSYAHKSATKRLKENQNKLTDLLVFKPPKGLSEEQEKKEWAEKTYKFLCKLSSKGSHNILLYADDNDWKEKDAGTLKEIPYTTINDTHEKYDIILRFSTAYNIATILKENENFIKQMGNNTNYSSQSHPDDMQLDEATTAILALGSNEPKDSPSEQNAISAQPDNALSNALNKEVDLPTPVSQPSMSPTEQLSNTSQPAIMPTNTRNYDEDFSYISDDDERNARIQEAKKFDEEIAQLFLEKEQEEQRRAELEAEEKAQQAKLQQEAQTKKQLQQQLVEQHMKERKAMLEKLTQDRDQAAKERKEKESNVLKLKEESSKVSQSIGKLLQKVSASTPSKENLEHASASPNLGSENST